MSETHKTDSEHGTVQSYVVGFILSLIFTLIPYYLVVHQTFSSSALLPIIIGFAVIQMIIQITFFLHIGRGPKPNWNLFFFASTVGIILVVVGGSIVIINNLHYNMQPSDQTKKLIADEGIYQIGGQLTGACREQAANHQVIINNSRVIPVRVLANQCDTLTFISGDGSARKVVFGTYPQNQSYAGESNLVIRKGQNQTITLSQTGAYRFYDQSHPAVSGEFVVGQ